MILVTGATGTIGRDVVRGLVERGEQVRAMTRDPSRLPARPGLDVVRADFADPGALRAAAAGATALFLLSAPGPTQPVHDLAMLDVAKASGVARIVKLSAIGTGTTDDFHDGVIGAWHRPGEDALRESRLAWTLLRPTTFASNTLAWADPIRQGVPVTNLSGAGTQGVVDPRDVAAVAIEALVSARHTGQIYTLTGPDLLSVPDQVAIIGKVLDRATETVDLTPDAARDYLLAAGMDSGFAEVVLLGSEFVRSGGNAVRTDDVERVLGRPPTSFETWVREHAAAFTS